MVNARLLLMRGLATFLCLCIKIIFTFSFHCFNKCFILARDLLGILLYLIVDFYLQVTRTELISSLRGLTIANRRRGHLLSGSQQPGTSEDAAQRSSKRGSGRNPSGRKALKVQWAVAEGEEQEMEEEEEEEEQNPYSDAVAHLSEICANLADYLNENPSLSEEEEEEEKESDDDDANDDAEDGQEDDDYEDMEDEDEQDDKPEDDDEDEDDGGDDAVITSEESHGLDGATPESSISPVMSQGSRESCLSGDSSSSRHTPQPTQLTSSQTTLLGKYRIKWT